MLLAVTKPSGTFRFPLSRGTPSELAVEFGAEGGAVGELDFGDRRDEREILRRLHSAERERRPDEGEEAGVCEAIVAAVVRSGGAPAQLYERVGIDREARVDPGAEFRPHGGDVAPLIDERELGAAGRNRLAVIWQAGSETEPSTLAPRVGAGTNPARRRCCV